MTRWSSPSRCLQVVAGTLVFAGIASAQTTAPVSAPIPMPVDRVVDSYAIYSQLMPGGEFSSSSWPRKQWLIEDTTSAMPQDKPCRPAEGDRDAMTNPHNAISAPTGREADLEELLEDYDQHCHDRIRLDAAKFHLLVPFRLLDADERQRFIGSRFAPTKGKPTPAAEFDGAPGLNSFSEVYFNAHHSMALVYAGQWCGGLCGKWYWVVLERKDGVWLSLPWVHALPCHELG